LVLKSAATLLNGLLTIRCWWLAIFFCIRSNGADLPAAGAASGLPGGNSTNYNVRAFAIAGKSPLAADQLLPLLDRHAGTNVSLQEISQAALDLQAEFRRQGFPSMNVSVAPGQCTNGILKMTVFRENVAHILISGKRYFIDHNELVTEAPPPGAGIKQNANEVAAKTNGVSASAPTANATPHLEVQKYDVFGNTLLPPETIGKVVLSANGATGTNVSVDQILGVASRLQEAYHDRGYVTVAVGVPPQRPTNATIKVQVTEGRLASIQVKDNHYFSSNNVMSSLPSLRTNMILNAKVFQAELNRANANQDRKISPIIEPGPDPGTSELLLDVKERAPVHAKVELNNEGSPGTPDLRVNSSAVYGNLWQLEQSLGLQYSFSPEMYKAGPQWNFYDQPLVANYSGFYRIPLGSPESIAKVVADHPGNFGYDEGTRKFNLPPSSGQPDLTFFASRSTIDTGLQTTSSANLVDEPGVETITQTTVQQDLTVNNDLAARFSSPLQIPGGIQADISGGLDFKGYQITSFKTNNFVTEQITLNSTGQPNPPVISTLASTVPTTRHLLNYLPLSGRVEARLHDSLGLNTFGLGLGVNLWYSGSRSNLQSISSSAQTTGHWVVLNPSYSRTLEWVTNWVALFRADGQWASEPLIANEQFGIGGVNSVRGYQEGQIFGDSGWHVSLEQQTPPHTAGFVYQGVPLTIRGSVFMDYAEAYLLDPQGRQASTGLWGTGVGGIAAIGSHFEARFLFSLPLFKTANTEAFAPFFNFSLTAQF
jgi:hemolysin activation/secretion protein